MSLRSVVPATRGLRTRTAGAVRVLGLTLALVAPLGAHAAAPEAAIKAAYLSKLAPFAGWPADALPAAGAPFVICIQGADPFGALLDEAVGGQRIGGRPIVVSRLGRVDATSDCQLAYVAGSEVQPRAAALDALRGSHVLTVTDEANGVGPRGMVHFVLRDGRVRFEIDLRQADAAGVTISSKLLALAVSVVR